jgi:hypothetical protein
MGSLSRLRGQCRVAKEQLSTSAATSIAVDLPGNRTDVRVTRNELDDAIRAPVTGFIELLQETLQRSGIRPNDLVAVASVGGVAHLPILTTALSEHLRVPVISSNRPELAAAIGGGLTAVRGTAPDEATSMAPAAAVVPAAVPAGDAQGSSTFRALAWSDADDLPEPMPADSSFVDYGTDQEAFDPRPPMTFTHPDDEVDEVVPLPWYRRPLAIFVIGLIVVAAVLAGIAFYVLRNDESTAPTPSPSSSTTAPPAAPPASEAPPTSEAPPGSEAPPAPQAPAPAPQPAVTQTVTQQAPPPPPPSEAPPPPPPSEAPSTQPTQPPPPSSQQPIIPTLPYQTIPGLPFVPAPVQPQP